jgi:hypothetical protein
MHEPIAPAPRSCPAVSWPSDEAVRAGRFGACVIAGAHETTRGMATIYTQHRDEHGYKWWSPSPIDTEITDG